MLNKDVCLEAREQKKQKDVEEEFYVKGTFLDGGV